MRRSPHQPLLVALGFALLTACAHPKPPWMRSMDPPLEALSPSIHGPKPSFIPTTQSTLLASDAHASRALLYDQNRIALWDTTRTSATHATSLFGDLKEASIAPDQNTAFALSTQSARHTFGPTLHLLNVPDLRPRAHINLPCACFLSATFSAHSDALHVLLSAESIDGTWAVSWATDGTLISAHHLTPTVLDNTHNTLLYEPTPNNAHVLITRSDPSRNALEYTATSLQNGSKTHAGTWDTSHANLRTQEVCGPSESACRLHIAHIPTPESSSTHTFALTQHIPERNPSHTVALYQTNAHSPLWTQTPNTSASPLPPSSHLLQLQHTQHLQPPRALWIDTQQKKALWSNVQTPLPLLSTQHPSTARGAMRSLFALPPSSIQTVWSGGTTTITPNLDTQGLLITSLHGTWLLNTAHPPRFLPSKHIANSIHTFPTTSPHNLEELAIVRSRAITLFSNPNPTPLPRDSTPIQWLASAEYSPPEGFLRTALQTHPNRLFGLVKYSDTQGQWVSLQRRGDPRLSTDQLTPTHTRPFTLSSPGSSWRLLYDPTHHQTHTLTLHREHKGELLLQIHTTHAETARLLAIQHRILPVDHTRIATAPHTTAVALFGRTSVSLIDLNTPYTPRLSWTPPDHHPAPWIKGVLPITHNTILVRHTSEDRPSQERWTWLRLEYNAPPTVLARDTFHRVIAHTVTQPKHQPHRRAVHILEQNGTLSTIDLNLKNATYTPRSALWLHPTRPAWVRLSPTGHLTHSKQPAEAFITTFDLLQSYALSPYISHDTYP